jgi:hypothetical protein|tara:strand:- start:331 stop:465 length:135 start_codon:yes stop_codon:yes gene_type:complete
MGINNSHWNVANKKNEMNIALIIWSVIILWCILEAYFTPPTDEN